MTAPHQYFCCDERRRNSVRAHATLNGIDFIEVDDDPSKPNNQRQRRLFVHLLKTGFTLNGDNVRVEGGEVVRSIGVTGTSSSGHVLTVDLDNRGDFAPYTLRLVASPLASEPPAGFDPLLSSVEFSFKVNCPSDFDCRAAPTCTPAAADEPDLSYLAKDFNSFRQLMLDRMSALVPEWRETSMADLMHVLIDLKAYVADYQSYAQDGIATEAYLGTARRRTSLRRHARLVDYFMHDGASARAWVQIELDPTLPPGTAVSITGKLQFLTEVPGKSARLAPDSAAYRETLDTAPLVFESVHGGSFYPEHERMSFYTWGDDRCCLPQGATRATLRGKLEFLREGDILIFEEIVGPETGAQADRDLRHRQAVRLIEVQTSTDDLPETPVDVTGIVWHADDALMFPLCLTARVPDPEKPGSEYIAEISVARGNIVLADHGRTLPPEPLPAVERPELTYVSPGRGFCADQEPDVVPLRFRPRLARAPLTQAVAYTPVLARLPFSTEAETQLNAGTLPQPVETAIRARRVIVGSLSTQAKVAGFWVSRNLNSTFPIRHEGAELVVYDPPSASAVSRFKAAEALPAAELQEEIGPGTTIPWRPVHDLLSSDKDATEFVAEVESDGTATLRFGDDTYGKRPDGATKFTATYRVGNGKEGNIGADSLRHVVTANTSVAGVRNPMPATGGVDLETIEEVRTNAPEAFRTLERAVTAEDYATIALRHPEVQRAVARFRWTGSWYTVFLAVDRKGGRELDDLFKADFLAHMERYRMAGYDLDVRPPEFVPIEIAIKLCVKSGYSRSETHAAVADLLSNRVLPDGRKGIFHPDQFSFGDAVHLSRIYAAAMSVPGVEHVDVTVFRRQNQPGISGLDSETLEMGTLEVAQLENDRNYPRRGSLKIDVKGGS